MPLGCGGRRTMGGGVLNGALRVWIHREIGRSGSGDSLREWSACPAPFTRSLHVFLVVVPVVDRSDAPHSLSQKRKSGFPSFGIGSSMSAVARESLESKAFRWMWN